MRVFLTLIVMIAGITPLLPLSADEVVTSFSARELKEWPSYGSGEMALDHGQLLLAETENSAGYMIVSPERYEGDIVVEFEIMPLRAAAVCIVELLAEDPRQELLTFPDDYNGNVKYLFQNLNFYMVAFHNGAHNKAGPFIRQFPKPGAKPLVAAERHYFELGKYRRVKVGRSKGMLWMEVEGDRILEIEDQNPIPGGHIIFRVRGTGPEIGSFLVRNVEIRTFE